MQTGYTSNGIMFTEEIVSIHGAAFVLFIDDTDSPQKIAAAKREIRNNWDAVSLKIATAWDRDDYYKSQIFQHPATKPLEWYEIEQDEVLLRRERVKGTTPEQFVLTYVLPFTEQTKQKYLAKYGESIYKI